MMYQTKEFTGATHTDVAIWVSICVVGWVSWLFAILLHIINLDDARVGIPHNLQ